MVLVKQDSCIVLHCHLDGLPASWYCDWWKNRIKLVHSHQK
jgi:hypothetical protein